MKRKKNSLEKEFPTVLSTVNRFLLGRISFFCYRYLAIVSFLDYFKDVGIYYANIEYTIPLCQHFRLAQVTCKPLTTEKEVRAVSTIICHVLYLSEDWHASHILNNSANYHIISQVIRQSTKYSLNTSQTSHLRIWDTRGINRIRWSTEVANADSGHPNAGIYHKDGYRWGIFSLASQFLPLNWTSNEYFFRVILRGNTSEALSSLGAWRAPCRMWLLWVLLLLLCSTQGYRVTGWFPLT